MRILVLGSDGQLGNCLRDAFFNLNSEIVFSDRNLINLLEIDNIENRLNEIKPDIIINAAAYTNVDNAEKEQVFAETINYKAPNIIAKFCSNNDVKLIHISTDYVYSGNANKPYTELTETNPISIYGKTKLLGDEAIANNMSNYFIIRTSWVYSEYGKNFLKTMVSNAKLKQDLKVVGDQVGSPTYAGDIAST